MIKKIELPEVDSRVGVVYGPGEQKEDNQGVVTMLITDKWGSRVQVSMDCGSTEICHGLTKVGIGWYQISANNKDI